MAKLEFIKNSERTAVYDKIVQELCNYYNRQISAEDIYKYLDNALGKDWAKRLKILGQDDPVDGIYKVWINIDTLHVGTFIQDSTQTYVIV